MKITPKRSFVGRDGNHISFGKEVNVSDEDGKYYVSQGWATAVKSGEAERAIDPATSGTTGLDIDGRNEVERRIDEEQIPEGVDYKAEADPEKAKKESESKSSSKKSDSKK